MSGRSAPGLPSPRFAFRLLAIDSTIEKKMMTAKKISSSMSRARYSAPVRPVLSSGPAMAFLMAVSASMLRYFW